ncbi:hypothetical protein HHI36_002477 [Cryptolaemus montrouzieri]|uniref:Uncharacterized protein n=1 Tax=Cryptolaemus montrouzieri TaxID=559131 RepID=A0ABD2PB39_9CUCU
MKNPHKTVVENVNNPVAAKNFAGVAGLTKMSYSGKKTDKQSEKVDNAVKIVSKPNVTSVQDTNKIKQVIRGTGDTNSNSATSLLGAKRLGGFTWAGILRRQQLTPFMTISEKNFQFIVEQLAEREGANCRPLKVGVDLEILDDLYKGENWPENITIRRFQFFRAEIQNHPYEQSSGKKIVIQYSCVRNKIDAGSCLLRNEKCDIAFLTEHG